MGPALQTLQLFFMSGFCPGWRLSLCCVGASVSVAFPAQLEAGGTRDSAVERRKGSGEVSSANLTPAGLPAAQHPAASPLPPLPSFCSLLLPNPPLMPTSLPGGCTKPSGAVGAGAGAGRRQALSSVPCRSACPGADGSFLKWIRYSESLTEAALAQTNPRPPAKPSFGPSICPAAGGERAAGEARSQRLLPSPLPAAVGIHIPPFEGAWGVWGSGSLGS